MARPLLLILHNLLLPFALLFMAPAALRKMKARGGKVSDLWQRFGFFRKELRQKLQALQTRENIFWLHAASVGEVGIAVKLIRELRKLRPHLGIVLTTTTPTGYAEASKAAARIGDHLVPLYSALDGWFIVRRFLKAIRPDRLILVESEIWPNILYACLERGIPVSLVNARLSPRSEARYQKMKPFARAIFSMFSQVCVQEPEDAERWEGLGVLSERIKKTGSIKFDTKDQNEPVEQTVHFRQLLQRLGWSSEDPVLLAASTHPGEEMAITKVYFKLKAAFPSLRLLIVPRHVERGTALLRELSQAGLETELRSTFEFVPPDPGTVPDCLLVDTTGELRAWQYLATAVIVGKSFLASGGQNPAEAVMAGKPVLFGPHMENFESLVRHLRAHGGAIRADGFTKLEEKLLHLLKHPEFALQTALAGREALLPHAGATHRTADCMLAEETF